MLPSENSVLSKNARKRANRALLKAGALILPHQEARLIAPRPTYADGVWEALDRRIREALARCEASERRTRLWIEERGL